jgi:arylsulfatase A-like enzyme
VNALRDCKFLLAGGLLLGVATASAAAPRPNILLIFADDLGRGDVSCYGSEIRTPHIDSLARDGVKFESFYVAAPVCTASRFGLLTGRYPARSHDKLFGALMFLQERDATRGIRPDETTIAEVLQRAGYRTAIIGKWHLGHGRPEFSPRRHGFDHAYGSTGGCVDYFTQKYGDKPDWHRNDQPIEEKGYTTDLITDEAVRWLGQQHADEPFFLYLPYTAPHYGKGWDADAKKPTNVLQAKPADRERFRYIGDEKRREYAAMVGALDDGVGRVLETLRRAKLDQNTLIIFTSDNGGDPKFGGNNKPLRGVKNEVWEGGIREPCLMVWPGKIKPASVIRDPAGALDFFPTFCDLAGVNRDGLALDGASLAPLLLEGKSLPARDLFWQQPNGVALRRGSWKYLRIGKEEMLFNLDDDPSESKDRAREKPEMLKSLKSAHAAIAATLPK